MSDALVATLARATDYAASQPYAAVTLEHLLLAITEDGDAAHVLEASAVDLARLRNDVAGFLGQQPPSPPPAGTRPVPDPDLSKILTYAEAAARQSGRAEINGAIVLAAIVGEGRSMAATFLKAQGLTFQAAIRAIKKALAAPTPAPPAPEPTEREIAPPPPEAAPPAEMPVATPPAAEHPRPPAPEIRRPTPIDAPPSPPSPRPRWEPVGISKIDPPARAEAPLRPPEPIAPVAPPQAREPAPTHPAPPPDATHQREPQKAAPPPPRPAAGTPANVRLEPPRPQQAALPPADAPPPPPPSPNLDIRPGGPPPLPERNAGRRAPESPPPIPPAGLGSPRPPPPRPSLRLPARDADGPQVTAPWPAETTDDRPPTLSPPPRVGPPQLERPNADYRGSRVAPARPSRTSPPPGQRAAMDRGQLVENIPRRMKVGVPETFEVRIAREGVDPGRAAGNTPAHPGSTPIARATSVRVQSEPGRFYIEGSSPETQWSGTRGDQIASDYSVWRFTVIPQFRGRAELILTVSARSIGTDGTVAETSLPEQRIAVRVSPNVTRGMKRWGTWIVVAALGGVLTKAGETFWEPALALIRRIMQV